jgi:hypothetical protein
MRQRGSKSAHLMSKESTPMKFYFSDLIKFLHADAIEIVHSIYDGPDDGFVGPTSQEEYENPSTLMILADRSGCIREEMESIYNFLCCARALALGAVCALLGHAWIDNGFGGPDSGCIEMECTRCGFSAPTVWLY